MVATHTSGRVAAGRRYHYWRSPSGFWTRRIACDRPEGNATREQPPLIWTRSAACRAARRPPAAPTRPDA